MKIRFKSIILAAGLGTRLMPYTKSTPKCLMKVGSKPILGYWIDHLYFLGCEKVIVNTHYHSEMVDQYLANLHYKNMSIETFHEKKLLGTAKTLISNVNNLKGGEILLMHVDNYSKVNLGDLLNAHQNREKDTLLTMLTFNSKNPSQCGIVEKNKNDVMTSFHEKVINPPSQCANGAIYILSEEFIRWLIKNKSNAIDFSNDVLPSMNGLVQTWHTELPFIDIGTPETLFEAQNLAANYLHNGGNQ